MTDRATDLRCGGEFDVSVQRSQLYREGLSQHVSLKIRSWKLLALIVPSQYTVLKYLRDSLALYGRTVSSVGSENSSS